MRLNEIVTPFLPILIGVLEGLLLAHVLLQYSVEWNGACNRTKVAIILDPTKFDPRTIKNGVTISTLSLALIKYLCENEISLDIRNFNNLRIDS